MKSRSGAGSTLFNQIKAYFQSHNKKCVCVWGLKNNTTARNFYEKMGGILSSQIKEVEIGGDLPTEVVYLFNF